MWNEGSELDGIAEGISFSLWFYLGIEELPMVTEETINATKTMPIGIIGDYLKDLSVLNFV